MNDPIKSPAHYVQGRTIEPLAVIEDWNLDFHLAQTVKYVARFGRKGRTADWLNDLKKARFYLDRLIGLIEEEGE